LFLARCILSSCIARGSACLRKPLAGSAAGARRPILGPIAATLGPKDTAGTSNDCRVAALMANHHAPSGWSARRDPRDPFDSSDCVLNMTRARLPSITSCFIAVLVASAVTCVSAGATVGWLEQGCWTLAVLGLTRSEFHRNDSIPTGTSSFSSNYEAGGFVRWQWNKTPLLALWSRESQWSRTLFQAKHGKSCVEACPLSGVG
jgi:hypothetical protein